jgi:sugar phosphate isomerase/epimerase
MSVSFDISAVPAAYRTAERLAEQYDLQLMIHNHGGRHWLGNAETLAHVFRNTSERIGLVLDTAWAMDAREDPVALAERFAGRLYGLHLKDFVFDEAGRHRDVVVGTGNLDLERLNETLKRVGFDGALILEYEGDPQDPVPALRDCVREIRARMT